MRPRLLAVLLMATPSAIAAEPKWPAPIGTISFKLGANTEYPVFRTTDGIIWMIRGWECGERTEVRRLMRWTGKTWETTPPLDLPHEAWARGQLPPWRAWHTPLGVVTGAKGSLLAVAVGDTYQQAPKGQDKEDPDVPDVLELKKQQAAALAKVANSQVGPDTDGRYSSWYVGWLFDGGKWVGPLELSDLLKQERANIAKLLSRAHPGHAPWNIVADGRNIWAFFDNKVHLVTEKGIAAWEVPAGPQESPRLNRVKLAATDEGLWCAWAKGRERVVTLLTEKDGKIEAKDLPEAGLPPDGSPLFSAWAFHVARDGRLFYSGAVLPKAPQNVLMWKDNKWLPFPELRCLVDEDADGTLWFMPNVRKTAKENGYRILQEHKPMVVAAPAHIRLGFLTDAGPGRKIGTFYDQDQQKYGIAEWKTAAESPGGWTVARVWHSDNNLDVLDGSRVFVDAKGTFIHDTGAIGKVTEIKERP
jgi:hypothetical protein